VVNEINVLHKWTLLETECVTGFYVLLAKNTNFAVDKLQVVDPVGAAASVEDDAADIVAALLVNGWEPVPEFRILFFFLVLHCVGVKEFSRLLGILVHPAVICGLFDSPVDVHAFTLFSRSFSFALELFLLLFTNVLKVLNFCLVRNDDALVIARFPFLTRCF
jgi:hypothetical protein